MSKPKPKKRKIKAWVIVSEEYPLISYGAFDFERQAKEVKAYLHYHIKKGTKVVPCEITYYV